MNCITLGSGRLAVRILILSKRPESATVTGSKVIDGVKYEFGYNDNHPQVAWEVTDE